MSSVERSIPSRAELLRDGGLFAIPVPLGWRITGAEGRDAPIPRVEGDVHHHVHARGDLLATEEAAGRPPEAMMLRRFALSSPPSARILSWYANLVIQGLMMQGLGARVVSQEIAPCSLSPLPCAKLAFERMVPSDDRREIHYLVVDPAGRTWELIYLIRRDNVDAWTALLDEIDTPPIVRSRQYAS